MSYGECTKPGSIEDSHSVHKLNYQNNTVQLDVDSIQSIYDTRDDKHGLIANHLYRVISAHLPGNNGIKYTIIDEKNLVEGLGRNELSIREVHPSEIPRLIVKNQANQWYDPTKKIYETQWLIDVKKYFKNCSDWSNTVNHWITEGLQKDSRLVEVFKASIIPLPFEPLTYQHLNSHVIQNTNTGVGKSFFPYLLGEEPIIGATEASALGSYDQSKSGTTIVSGFLQGHGFPVFLDEVNTIDKPVIQKLLTYLEQGVLTRGLKHRIEVRGVKTIVLTGNPSSKVETNSLDDFLQVVCTTEEPARLGRRFGFLLVGNDYLRVRGEGDSSLRNEIRNVISTTIKQYGKEIQREIDSQFDWIYQKEEALEAEIRYYAAEITHPTVSEFVKGQSYGCIHRLKTSAIRYTILDQLDQVPNGNIDFSAKDETFRKLLLINEDSWKKLAKIKPTDMSAKDWALELSKEYPELSYRKIADIVGYSHTSVNKWLKEGKH